VEQVSHCRYLGSLISEDGYCTKDIQSRTEILVAKVKVRTLDVVPLRESSPQGTQVWHMFSMEKAKRVFMEKKKSLNL